mgnify:CR=1 FL=1
MNKLITVILVFFISHDVLSQNQDEVKKYVVDFLSKHKPRIGSDSLNITEGVYHVILLQKIKSSQVSIYKFGFSVFQYSTNYILIIDNKRNSWTIFGQNEFLLNIKSITKFFSETPKIKKSTILRCYNYLIDNTHGPKKWILMEPED